MNTIIIISTLIPLLFSIYYLYKEKRDTVSRLSLPLDTNKKLTIFKGFMGSGKSFYISQLFFSNKNTLVFKRLYSNDHKRLKDLKEVLSRYIDEPLYIIIETPNPIEKEIFSILQDLIENEYIFLVLDILDNGNNNDQYNLLSKDHIIYQIEDYRLREINSDSSLYLSFNKNDLYKKLD